MRERDTVVLAKAKEIVKNLPGGIISKTEVLPKILSDDPLGTMFDPTDDETDLF